MLNKSGLLFLCLLCISILIVIHTRILLIIINANIVVDKVGEMKKLNADCILHAALENDKDQVTKVVN